MAALILRTPPKTRCIITFTKISLVLSRITRIIVTRIQTITNSIKIVQTTTPIIIVKITHINRIQGETLSNTWMANSSS